MIERRYGTPDQGLHAILSSPVMYDLVQSGLGAGRARRRIVSQHIRPKVTDEILDIGCGTGELLPYLPAGVRYVGFDLSERYIESAKRRHGAAGRFDCMDVADFRVSFLEGEGADLVLAIGLLHHLDDHLVGRLMAVAFDKLRPGGRLITMDPTLVDGQSRIARGLILRDRGKSIRSPEGYSALAAACSGRSR